MLFCLHGAAATFQHLVDMIMGPYNGFTLAYIDDIIIHSRTWTEHLEHLSQLLRCFQAAELKVNPKKSKLGFTKLEYLSYKVGGSCLRPQTRKLEAIKQATLPCTKKQLRQFLGMVGYYSHFIKDFATHAAPLTDRLGKIQHEVLSWDTLEEATFQNLRHALMARPMLASPGLHATLRHTNQHLQHWARRSLGPSDPGKGASCCVSQSEANPH